MGATHTTADDAGTARSRRAAAPARHKRTRFGRPAPAPAPASVGGRRRSNAVNAALRADALTAAEILASHSQFWAPEQIFVHPEIAALALAEARTSLAAAVTGPRRGRKAAARDLEMVEQAYELLTRAQATDDVATVTA